MVRSERQQPLPMTLKLLIFSGFDGVHVSQFASQFVSRILVDGAAESVRLRMTAAGGSSCLIRPRCCGRCPKRNVLWHSSPTTRSPAFRRLPAPRRICLPNRRKHSTVQRDHEYKRLGTVTLSAPSSGIETSHRRWDHRSRNLEQNSSSGFLLRGLQVRVLLGSPMKSSTSGIFTSRVHVALCRNRSPLVSISYEHAR
jgi:hypothetical protein